MKLDQAYKKVYMTHGLSVVGERGGNVIVWDVMDNKPLLLVNFDSKKVDPMFAIFDTIRISLEQNNIPQLLKIYWVTKRDDSYNRAITTIVRPYERDFEETLRHLADIVNRRCVGQNRGALKLLMIDDLRYFHEVAPEALWDIEYILSNGYSVNVNVAACATGDVYDDNYTAKIARSFSLFVQRRKKRFFNSGTIHPIEL